ncbi:hypothetical protein KFK09_020163 [Dendrobium nobile]|uniref:Uncharacterized protein n=1 Tax=Dendrobium nobile TaxID=94219 RepID=A0A8T3AT15_DENNO|nr:hypothetical protein KFK09_020163 [Dendrobium nobile]
MRKRVRKFLQGAATAALLLTLVLVLLLAEGNQNSYRVEARKLLAMEIPAEEVNSSLPNSENDKREKPTRQAGVSFRWIPPSNSNPIQNKSRPHFDGGTGKKLG